MRKKDAIKYFGSSSAIADALGVTKSSVSQWGDKIPMLRAYQIERITNGALKVQESEFKKAS